MNFEIEFKKYLQSDENITYHTNLLLERCNIKKDNLNKIRLILTEMIQNIIPNLNNLPTNQQEFIEALNFTRNLIHDKFIIFLEEKYPGKQIRKSIPIHQIHQIHQQQHQINQNIQFEEQLIDDNQNVNQYISSINSHISAVQPRKQTQYITSYEKDLLLKKYGLNNPSNQHQKSGQQEFIKYLTNPTVLKNFWDMVQRMNPEKTVVKKSYRADMVVNHEQLNMYIQNVIFEASKSKSKTQSIQDKKNNNDIHVLNDRNSADPYADQKATILDANEDIDGNNDEIIIPTVDITKGINVENMAVVSQTMKELSEMKLKYKDEKDIIEAVDEELHTLVSALKQYRESVKQSMNEYDNKIKVIKNKNDNEEILKLEVNPNDDGSDMKKIEIDVTDNRKIKKITLMDYYVPLNVSNISRSTNHFGIFTNGQPKNIYIPPAKYDDIFSIINYIKGVMSFIDIKVENNIITINNLLGKFDLIINEKSIFPILGFREKSEKYRGESTYTGNVPYDINANSIVYFSIHSTNIDPIKLVFDKETIADVIVKKSNSGVSMKKISMEFTNKLGQIYDFILPFRIGLKIEFTK